MNKILRKIRKIFYLNQIRLGPRFGRLLIALLRSLKVDYPDAEILGHCELEGVHKDCPSFDCQEYRDYFNELGYNE